MPTNLQYLNDPYRFTGEATVTGKGRGEKGVYIELDQTIFYPQGGGQPSDSGYIVVARQKIPVIFVGALNGAVQHFVPEAHFEAVENDVPARLVVDRPHRIQNARLHTAGHRVGHILETLHPRLIPIKGYHFNEGAHVEFIDESRIASAGLIDAVNEKIVADIEADKSVCAAMSNFNDVSAIRPDLAPFIPRDKPTRIVRIGDYKALPCGGTHMRSTSELTGLQITRVKRKKDRLKISYSLDGERR